MPQKRCKHDASAGWHTRTQACSVTKFQHSSFSRLYARPAHLCQRSLLDQILSFWSLLKFFFPSKLNLSPSLCLCSISKMPLPHPHLLWPSGAPVSLKHTVLGCLCLSSGLSSNLPRCCLCSRSPSPHPSFSWLSFHGIQKFTQILQ